jgi:hypothetical protein
MALLSPTDLEAGAVVPQSVDNQFVTAELFAKIRAGKLDYDDPVIRAGRSAASREELIRSLVYAPQMVVNRAFLFNNEFLYDLFSEEQGGGIDAFGKLITKAPETEIQAIVPFLYQESSLTERVDFGTAPAGAQAIAELLGRLGTHPDCVRLHADEDINLRLTSDFGKRFGDYFDTLQNFDPKVSLLLMDELVGDEESRRRLQDPDDPSYVRGFRRAFRHVCSLARQYNDEKAAVDDEIFDGATDLKPMPPLPRNYLYRELFAGSGGDDAVARGAFGGTVDPAIENYVFEIKKLIDLRYNTILPDLLDRYTFSPVGFPTRSALHDQHMTGAQHQVDDMATALDDVRKLTMARQDFMGRHQQIQYSPYLADLDLDDVLAIRATKEWAAFTSIQRGILEDPVANLADGLEDLHQSFAKLQWVIASRYRSRAPIGDHYGVWVTAAVSIGGTMVAYGLDDFGYVDDLLLASASTFLPENLKGMAVKLVYNVVNLTTGVVSKRRSWQFEIARSEEAVPKDVALEFFRAARAAGGHTTTRVEGLAEQERN